MSLLALSTNCQFGGTKGKWPSFLRHLGNPLVLIMYIIYYITILVEHWYSNQRVFRILLGLIAQYYPPLSQGPWTGAPKIEQSCRRQRYRRRGPNISERISRREGGSPSGIWRTPNNARFQSVSTSFPWTSRSLRQKYRDEIAIDLTMLDHDNHRTHGWKVG